MTIGVIYIKPLVSSLYFSPTEFFRTMMPSRNFSRNVGLFDTLSSHRSFRIFQSLGRGLYRLFTDVLLNKERAQ